MKKILKLFVIVMALLICGMPCVQAQAIGASRQKVESKFGLEQQDVFQVDGKSYECFSTHYGDRGSLVFVFFDDQRQLVQDDILLEKLAQLLILNGYNHELEDNLKKASESEKAFMSLRIYQTFSMLNTVLGKATGAIGTFLLSKGTMTTDAAWYAEEIAWAIDDVMTSGAAVENQALDEIKKQVSDAKSTLEKRGSKKQKNYNEAIEYINAATTLNLYAQPFNDFCASLSPTGTGNYFTDAGQSFLEYLNTSTDTAADIAIGSVDEGLATIKSVSHKLDTIRNRIADIPALVREVGMDTALSTHFIPSLAEFCHAVDTTQNPFVDSVKWAALRIGEQCTEAEIPQKAVDNDIPKLTGANWPETLTVGQAYSVFGAIELPSGTSAVAVGVYSGNQMVTGVTTKQPLQTFNIHDFDNKILFNHLDRGVYAYKIIITDENGVAQVLLDKSFEVVGSENQVQAPESNRMTWCEAYVTLPKRVVDLFSVPTDSSRLTYFDYGPTVRCDGYQIVNDRKFYRGYAKHKGVDMALWFEQADDMVIDVRHSYDDAGICECGAVLY